MSEEVGQIRSVALILITMGVVGLLFTSGFLKESTPGLAPIGVMGSVSYLLGGASVLTRQEWARKLMIILASVWICAGIVPFACFLYYVFLSITGSLGGTGVAFLEFGIALMALFSVVGFGMIAWNGWLAFFLTRAAIKAQFS